MLTMFHTCLKKNIYSAAVGWNVLYMSVRFFYSKAQFMFSVCLLDVCIDELSIAGSPLLLLDCCLLFPSCVSLFAYRFRHSNVEYIHIYNYYILLMN